ncbi:MAG TPA: hypothetical protein VED40_04105 [Azospirillaceae bacterium]|nr:hypothetical protein [Azospirillaceae bacterium]
MPFARYILDNNAAYLERTDGSRQYLHFVDQSIVRQTAVGDVTGDGFTDAVYEFAWGGIMVADYAAKPGTVTLTPVVPVIPRADLGGPEEVHLFGTANVLGTAARDVLYYRNAYDAQGNSHVTYYAQDLRGGSTIAVFDSARDGGHLQLFADLNGNGRADAVFRTAGGELKVKLDSGGETLFLTGVTRNPDIILASAGNFHAATPHDDLLFFDTASRTFTVWVRGPAGADAMADHFETVFTLPQNWSLIGTGDMDGDGINDIRMVDQGGIFLPYPRETLPTYYWSVGKGQLVAMGEIDPYDHRGGGNFPAPVGLAGLAEEPALP